jgi:Mn-dependent DtxR family transcriptional regulator
MTHSSSPPLIQGPEDIAEKDACAMEHELSEESIEQIRLFVEFMNTHPGRNEVTRDFLTFSRHHVSSPSPGVTIPSGK